MGSSVHGIFQSKKLEWASIPSLWDLPSPGMERRLASPALGGRQGLYQLSHWTDPWVVP